MKKNCCSLFTLVKFIHPSQSWKVAHKERTEQTRNVLGGWGGGNLRHGRGH